MSRRHLSMLAVALLGVFGLIAILLPEPTGRDITDDEVILLPGLAQRANAVDSITVTQAGQETALRLVRDDAGWRIVPLSGYPANMETMREVIAGLAQSRVIEPKTANPEYYSRLGVEDLDAEGARGFMIELAVGEEERWAVIVGDKAASRGGHYLRIPGTAESVLADFSVTVPDAPASWAEAEFIDLAAPEIAEVGITHADGEALTVRKISADENDFTLQELPAGRDIESTWAINSLGGLFSALGMEDVTPVAEHDWSEATKLRAITFSGLAVRADLIRKEGASWLRLKANTPFLEAAGASDENLEAAAAEINARVKGWAYQIPEYKAEAMTKRLEDLLKKEGSEADSASK